MADGGRLIISAIRHPHGPTAIAAGLGRPVPSDGHRRDRRGEGSTTDGPLGRLQLRGRRGVRRARRRLRPGPRRRLRRADERPQPAARRRGPPPARERGDAGRGAGVPPRRGTATTRTPGTRSPGSPTAAWSSSITSWASPSPPRTATAPPPGSRPRPSTGTPRTGATPAAAARSRPSAAVEGRPLQEGLAQQDQRPQASGQVIISAIATRSVHERGPSPAVGAARGERRRIARARAIGAAPKTGLTSIRVGTTRAAIASQ